LTTKEKKQLKHSAPQRRHIDTSISAAAAAQPKEKGPYVKAAEDRGGRNKTEADRNAKLVGNDKNTKKSSSHISKKARA
jgi:hypothetical protein